MTGLTGLCAFPITPSRADGLVDLVGLRKLVAPLRDAGVDSIGLLGSTGSYPYFQRQERRRALDVTLNEVGEHTPILVGVGALRTDEAIALAQDAKAGGAAAGLLAPVSYTPLLDDEVFEHFASVADRSGLPLCIYDNPGTTHFRFTLPLVERLSRVPGIIAIKSPAPDHKFVGAHLKTLRGIAPSGLCLGYSGDPYAVEAMIAGADTWYCVAAGFLPEVCMTVMRALRAGNPTEARRLNRCLQPLWDLFKEFSSLRIAYTCADLLGICRAQPPRPILPLPDFVRGRVAEALATIKLN